MVANPQALDVLRGLGARGIKRAVVTNTQTSLTEQILLTCGLREEVDIISAAEPGVPEKPDPTMLLKACEALGVDPADVRMVGDTDYDAQAAEAAGIDFLHYDLREGEDLAAALGQG
jgi:HAD superfamily hydrolase (TIGR01549 family)